MNAAPTESYGSPASSPPSEHAAEPPPSVGERWKVGALLGKGGMGAVYRGTHAQMGKAVAIKVIRPHADPTHQALRKARLLREARAIGALKHPHIVEVLDSGGGEGKAAYLVMELLSGPTLGAELKEIGQLPLERWLTLAEQLLAGLAYAHNAGVLHRDLKPENLVLSDEQAPQMHVKIVDFGIAKATNSSAPLEPLTREGVVVGTATYMSPEQAEGEKAIDHRSDLYSAAVILYEAATGHVPHTGCSSYEAAIVALCAKDAPALGPLRTDFPAALCEVIDRALQRAPVERFESAEAFWQALKAASAAPASATPASGAKPLAASETPTSEASPSPKGPPSKSPGRPVQLVALGALGAALFALSSAWFWPKPPDKKHSASSSAASTKAKPTPPVELELDISPPSARVWVDGKELRGRKLQGRALEEHTIRVEAPHHAPWHGRLRFLGQRTWRIALRPLPAAKGASPASIDSRNDSRNDSRSGSGTGAGPQKPPAKSGGAASVASKKPRPASKPGIASGLRLRKTPF